MNRFNHIFDMKNKKKAIFAFYAILLFAILGGIFVSYSASKSTPVLNQTESTSAIKLPPVTNQTVSTPAINEDKVLVAKIPEENIYLYANTSNMKNQLYSDLYKDLTLYSGGVSKNFFWHTLSMKGWEPTMLLVDLNNDNKKELIIILIHGKGTGLHLESVHILNKDTLTEFGVQPLEDIIMDNAKAKTNQDSYEININNQTYVINKSTLSSQKQNLFVELAPYKIGYYHFKVKDNILFATVKVFISPTESAGELVIEYMFQDSRYVMKSIIFNKDK